MTALPALRYAWRTRPVVATAAVALAATPFVRWVGNADGAPIRLRLVGLLLAALLALVWEDGTAPLAAASPVGLPALQRARLGLLLLVACVAWALACWAATVATSDARVWSATVEVAAVAALLTAVVGALARERLGESLTAYPVPLLLVLLALAFRVPHRWVLITGPGSPQWTDMHRRWAALLALGLVAIVVVSRDPANRPLRRLLRRTG